jgi:hypothetical protein
MVAHGHKLAQDGHRLFRLESFIVGRDGGAADACDTGQERVRTGRDDLPLERLPHLGRCTWEQPRRHGLVPLDAGLDDVEIGRAVAAKPRRDMAEERPGVAVGHCVELRAWRDPNANALRTPHRRDLLEDFKAMRQGDWADFYGPDELLPQGRRRDEPLQNESGRTDTA